MNILSLFDWISCGRLALERAWIQVDKYFASEIDKYAIQIARKNYPDTVHIGSVTNVSYRSWCLKWKNEWCIPTDMYIWTISMIIWWSPCQDLSIAKKDGKGLQWEKSSLFFEYVRLLKEVKPKYFLLENVASMKKADKEEITRILTEIYPDTQCYLINSALVSAQNRKRLYWTNIQWVEQPEDKGIYITDVASTEEKLVIINRHRKIEPFRFHKCGKSPTLLSAMWTWGDNVPYIIDRNWEKRKLTCIELERLQTLPDNWTEWISNTQRYKAIGNGWTVDVIAHIFSYIK